MLNARSRREFLTDVGGGMLIASLGSALSAEMGLGSAALAEAPTGALTFGGVEPLVTLMQETAPEALMPILVEKLRGGATLKQLVSAASLANARAFGGEDYIGFHTFMAMAPAYQMAAELPEDRRALPVLKVIYRNANRLQDSGQAKASTLDVASVAEPSASVTDVALRDAVRRKDLKEAERLYARLAQGSPEDALNHLLLSVQDNTEVHRVVLVWRAWTMLDLVGREQAHTLLRQSVHYCVKAAHPNHLEDGAMANVIPAIYDQHKLMGRPVGTRAADNAWIEQFTQTLLTSTPDQAADAVAAALAEGMSINAIAESVALTANQIVLRDPGRPEKWASANKPAGSVHGDSVGVHASDAVNAWCNIARVSNPRNAATSLMIAAYEVARDRNYGGFTDLGGALPRPFENELGAVKSTDPKALLAELEDSIIHNDQARACATVARYGALGHAERPVFDLLLKYAISEDGALHAEKYYRTTSEEFSRIRPAFRWRQVVALARVTASEHGYAAPGYQQSCELLKVKA